MSENMEEYFEYLDGLRERGVTNMYGAGPYGRKEFGVDRYKAREIVLRWMRTFSERHPESST